jgi:hypothetical protein
VYVYVHLPHDPTRPTSFQSWKTTLNDSVLMLFLFLFFNAF